MGSEYRVEVVYADGEVCYVGIDCDEMLNAGDLLIGQWDIQTALEIIAGLDFEGVSKAGVVRVAA